MSTSGWVAGGRGQVDAVAADALVDPDRLHGCLHPAQPGRVGDLVQGHLLAPAFEAPRQDVVLLAGGRVAEADPQQEPVELGLGQRVGAFVLDRVRRREHVEGVGQREGLALDRDLPLLHGLEQGGLGLRRGPVDLVGQEQAGEQRPAAEVEGAVLLVVEERPGQVGRQQVGRELRAREVQAERARHRAGGQRLAQAREVLEQHVALGQDGGEHHRQRLPLADDGLLDLVQHGVAELGCPRGGE